MKRIFIVIFLITLSITSVTFGQTNYYSSSSSDMTSTDNWWTNTNGTGYHPPDFTTTGQVFNVQNGHKMTASAIWTVSGTGSKVIIKTGGQITASGFNHNITLDMENEATYIVTNTYSNLKFGTLNTNSNFQLDGTGGWAASRTYPTVTQNNGGSLTLGNVTINGNLIINSGSTCKITGSDKTYTASIAGNLIIYGSFIGNDGGTGIATLNLGGSVNGGSFSAGSGSGGFVLNFTGGSSSVTFAPSSTFTSNGDITIATDKEVTLGQDITLSTNNTFTITTSGTLNCGTSVISGTGNFSLYSGATLSMGSPEGISSNGETGNIQVSGTRSFNSTANYEYNGSSIQVTGSALTTANNLKINNANGVTLSNNVAINGILTLTSGNLNTSSLNLLTLASSATISGGSSSSFINGSFAHTVDGTTLTTKTFPIGKDTYYRPLTLAVTQDAATSTTYTAEVFNAAPTSRTLPGTLDNISTVRYWNITKNSGANITAAAVTLNYDSDDGVSDYANLRIAKDDGSGNWIDLGGTGTANTSGSITSTTNFTSFSDFVLANATGGANPLPVELSSFTSVIKANDVVLNWSTATEVNNYGFSVERASTPLGTSSIGMSSILSSGDEGWKEIGFVNGNGNSNCPKEYSFVDNTLTASGKYSYRLKQIDTDGKFEYSNEIEVDYVKANSFNLAQNFPNPFNPVTVINYHIPANSYVTLKVYDLLGKEVSTLVNGNMDAGDHNVNFNASSLSAGTYFYKLQAGDYSAIKKLMLVK